MSALEDEVKELHAWLTRLEELVRVGAVAEQFSAGTFEIRDGDFVRFDDNHAARVHINCHSGKWTYTDRNGRYIEPFSIPPEEGIERLYTIAEVAEILAKAKKGL